MHGLLKRLELNGFKSFAQRTVLEFPSGITAIVGPNGSGKSNIVDAIRWLLGEREAKNLRGGKVEDLIFAGTPKRPRTGLAQASLHFENRNKFFPVDFEEVAVLREVRRDGASRYFLNKAEVLLRDLIDFFARARLGSRGFIVVTQGNSDMFIQASPRERREMIEEILGLREYQIKKLDAERRLKNSRINLEKARALIEEILPHLRSLKRQTGRWEKRGVLQEELKSLENQFFGSAWQELRSRKDLVEQGIARHTQSRGTLEKEKEAAEANLKKVEAAQPKEREEMAALKKETQVLLERRSHFQKELGRLEAQTELHRATPGAAGGQSPQKFRELVKSVRAKLESALGAEGKALEQAIRTIIEEIDSVLRGEAGDRAVPENVATSFEIVKKDLGTLEREMAALKEKEKKLEGNQEQFYHIFKSAVAALEAAKDKLEAWESEHQKKLFEKEKLDLRLQELEHQMAQAGRRPEEFTHITVQSVSHEESPLLERRIFKLRGDLASIGEVDEALMKEAKETEERYSFLKRECEDLEGAIKDLTELIGQLNEKIRTEFTSALRRINEEFGKFFGMMFSGGRAKLRLVVPERPTLIGGPEEEGAPVETVSDEEPEAEKEVEGGIEISLRLPRKKLSSLEVLSGGERSLVGIAALFAMISVSPPPFLVLDEIDAALDDRNARRFAEMLKEFSKKTQFIVVTHNRATMEAADMLYGVTLNEDGTSKIVSMKF